MRRAALTVVVVLAVAGCGGSHNISAQKLQNLVLAPADVGSAFTQFGDGPQITADNAGTNRSDPSRYGREGGWIARYRRAGTKSTKGPLVIESRADLFGGSGGARSDLAAYRKLLLGQPGVAPKQVAAPKVGDDAVMTTFIQAGALPVRYYRLAWRYRNATAALTVAGWDGKITAADVARLAELQQERLQHG